MPPENPAISRLFPLKTYLARDVPTQAPVILSLSETVATGDTMDVQGGGFTLTSTAQLQLIKSD